MFKFLISPNDVKEVCRWLTGNLDSVGKFRLARRVSPDDLNIAKYHRSSYIDNIENLEKLSEALSRLASKKQRTEPVKLLFKGMPKIGKTRAVYEKVITKLEDFLVFLPSPGELGKVRISELRPMPSKRGLILFLNDLDQFVARRDIDIDLTYLIDHIQRACPKLLVVATLRTGIEMTDKVMAERQGRDLLKDFLEISFRDISNEEAGRLARDIGKVQYEFDGKTPGSVVLGLEEMKHRLESFGTNERAVCKTLKLLYFAFQPNPEKELIETVSDAVFNTNFKNQRMNWDDCIKKLRENDLIKDLGMFITAPHGNFYFFVYDPDYDPTQDLFKLKDIFGENRDVIALVNLGTSFAVQLGRHKEALESFNKAIEIDPQLALAWVSKGTSLAKLDRYEEAIESYDKALEFDPKDALAWYNKGASLAKLDRYEEALESFNKAIEIDPQLALAWVGKGASLAELGRHEEAIESYDKALEFDPKDASTWYNKGASLAKLGRQKEAIESYDTAIEIDPLFFQAWHNKGVCLYNMGRVQEAEKCFKREREIIEKLKSVLDERPKS